MANIKINDLTLAGSVADNMQFETDIGGSTANKVTSLLVKNYVNAGQIGDKTITGSVDASGNLIFASTSNAVKGSYVFEELTTANGILRTDASGAITSSVDLPDGTTATTQAPLDNTTKVATTAYVDAAITVENIWDRSGTDVSLNNAGDTVQFDATGGIQFGGAGQNITVFDTDVNLAADSDSRLATQKATKDYVDNHTSNAIWTKTGTEITLTTITDTIGPANPLAYTTHPTFAGDTDLIDKKYVDDLGVVLGVSEQLTISSDGQTVFTLSQSVVATSVVFATVRGQFFDKTYGFNVSGTTFTWLNPGGFTLKTTDRLVVTYNYNLGASTAPQYWQRIGNDLTPLLATDDVLVKDIVIGEGSNGEIKAKTGTMTLTNGASGGIDILAVGGVCRLDATSGHIEINGDSPIEVNQTFDSSKILQYSSHPTFSADTDIIDKKYVDDHQSNGLWQRTATTLSVKNAGDDIDFSTAGVIKTASFDSTNLPSFDVEPTLTDRKQLASVGYVDDQAGLVVAKTDEFTATAAQTAFTLSETPSGTNSFSFFRNGLKLPESQYNFTGTALTYSGPTLEAGEEMVAWYDFQAPQGFLDLSRIYYVNQAGSDSNNGKSVESPFATIAAAFAAVAAESPAFNKRFEIRVLGGGNFALSGVLPQYTHLNAPSALLTGGVQLSTRSDITFNRLDIPLGVVGIYADNVGPCVIRGNRIKPTGTNTLFLFAENSANLVLEIPELDMTGASNGRLFNLQTSAQIEVRTNKIDEDLASLNDGTGVLLIDNVTDRAESFRAIMNAGQSGTGAGSTITVIYGTTGLGGYDYGNNYNVSTGQYTASWNGVYSFKTTLEFLLLTVANNDAEFEFTRRNSGGAIQSTVKFYGDNIGAALRPGIVNKNISGSAELYMDAGDTMEVRITISGGASDNVQLNVLTTQFSGHLIKTA